MDGRRRAALVEWLTARQNDMTALTRRLIAVPTENPPGHAYRECVEAIAEALHALGLAPSVIEPPAPDTRGAASLRAQHGDGSRALYFHGHYDVVPAQSPTQFQSRTEGDRLYGRGSADMKGGLVTMMYAAAALRAAGVRLDGRVVLTIVPDEETGGQAGSQHLVRQGFLGTDGIGMLTAEPTTGVVWNANRGAISMRISVRGRPAHVGLSHMGVNAFERMLDVAGRLRGIGADVHTRRTRFNIEPEAARASILLLGGRCEGGTNFNVVPDACAFTVDRRINPEEDLGTEKGVLLGLLDELRAEGVELDVEMLQEAPSAATGAEVPLARALVRNIEEVSGRPTRFEMCPGLLETRFYAQRGIPALAYGPGRLDVAHQANEHIEVPEMVRCAVIYALAAVEVLGENGRSAPV